MIQFIRDVLAGKGITVRVVVQAVASVLAFVGIVPDPDFVSAHANQIIGSVIALWTVFTAARANFGGAPALVRTVVARVRDYFAGRSE